MYRVTLLNATGAVVTSATEHSLADTANRIIALAEYAHNGDAGLLDVAGEATLDVRGLGNRELDAGEQDRLDTLLEEFGASRADAPNTGLAWRLA